jgi:hypothetical protein
MIMETLCSFAENKFEYIFFTDRYLRPYFFSASAMLEGCYSRSDSHVDMLARFIACSSTTTGEEGERDS